MKPTAIIDCDPGHDDVMAVLLGGRVLDLRAITTVFGNASLEQTTRNTRQTVEFAELTGIPIAMGMAQPLVRDIRHAPEVHGETGLDGPVLEPPTVPLAEEHATDVIIAESQRSDDLSLIPIGPLTNIATALHRDPSLPNRVKQISLMGGSLTFGIFCGLAILSFIFIYVLAPETKGRQLEAIRHYWYNGAKWPEESRT